jgi:hypothetical protein
MPAEEPTELVVLRVGFEDLHGVLVEAELRRAEERAAD